MIAEVDMNDESSSIREIGRISDMATPLKYMAVYGDLMVVCDSKNEVAVIDRISLKVVWRCAEKMADGRDSKGEYTRMSGGTKIQLVRSTLYMITQNLAWLVMIDMNELHAKIAAQTTDGFDFTVISQKVESFYCDRYTQYLYFICKSGILFKNKIYFSRADHLSSEFTMIYRIADIVITASNRRSRGMNACLEAYSNNDGMPVQKIMTPKACVGGFDVKCGKLHMLVTFSIDSTGLSFFVVLRSQLHLLDLDLPDPSIRFIMTLSDNSSRLAVYGKLRQGFSMLVQMPSDKLIIPLNICYT